MKFDSLTALVGAYRRPLQSALSRSAWVLLLVGVVIGAHVARAGTAPSRLGALSLIGVTLAALLLHRVLLARRFRDDEDAVRNTLATAYPELGGRVLRAVRLVKDVGLRTGESEELAQLHLARLLSRINEEDVAEASRRRARGYRQFALVGVAGAALLVSLLPWHLMEGLNVLAARRGSAPVEMEWLTEVQITATPPSYLRQSSGFLMLETAAALPEGTELGFRGKPLRSGRELVLTDGETEVPFVADGSGGVVAHWTLEKTVELRVAARFGETTISDPRSVEVFSQPDAVPRVVLKGAPREFRLQELSKLELLWDATDDHSLLQVDLVLRSAGREERRTLESFPGDKRRGQGGHVLYANDPFLKRVFLPVIVRVEARDNDPREGSKWGKSEAFIIRPPGVGTPEVNRFQALARLRDELVELLAATLAIEQLEEPKRHVEAREEVNGRVKKLEDMAARAFDENYSGLRVPKGWRSFMEGQFERLGEAFKRRRDERETVESIVLGVNSALTSLAAKDAADVARQLGDVAEEAAFAALLAQEPEKGAEGVERLDIAIQVLDAGAKELLELDLLGADLGSVALADLKRVRRARERKDFFHTELAAIHMAERLHRPNPSFGSKGGGGGSVESGTGSSGGGGNDAQGKPSDADSEFDRMARDLERLAQDHADLSERTSDAMRSAQKDASGEESKSEAEARAEALRRSVVGLPQPGEMPGTGRASAALMREHAGAMAQQLERMDFEGALESGRRAKAAAEEALRKGDLDPVTRQRVENALQELNEALKWARQQADRLQQLTEQAARQALEDFSNLERELAERASNLSQESTGEAALPKDVRDRLEQASRLMRSAAERLQGGQGDDAQNLQLEAQRLLEQSETGEMQQEDEQPPSSSEGDDGRKIRTGGDVPDPEEKNRAEDFRKRVLEGLGEKAGGRLSPAVKRYAEGLLR